MPASPPTTPRAGSLTDECGTMTPAGRCLSEWGSFPGCPYSAGDAATIQAPTLLVKGGTTLPLFKLLSDRFADLVPDIEVASASDAPHAVHFVSPEKFNRVVLEFLDRH